MSTIDQDLVTRGRRLLEAGAHAEDVVRMLSEGGATKREAIPLLALVASMTRREARLFVHNSEAFSEFKEHDEALHNGFLDALEGLAAETSSESD